MANQRGGGAAEGGCWQREGGAVARKTGSGVWRLGGGSGGW